MVGILVGPPGGGKDALTNFLVKHFGCQDVSTGNILRQEFEPESKMANLVSRCTSYCRQGQMVPDELIFPVWDEYAPNIRNMGRVIINGFPRTPKQAKHFVEKINLFAGNKIIHLIRLDVSEEACLDRMAKRGRQDDSHRHRRIKDYFDFTLEAIAILEKCSKILCPKPIKADHPDLSPEESMLKVARRACGMLGLPFSSIPQSALIPSSTSQLVAAQ